MRVNQKPQNVSKNVTGGVQKSVKIFVCPFLSTGQNRKNAKKRFELYFSFSELRQFEVGIRVQPNFPIVILSLLTVWHAFKMPEIKGAMT